MSTQTHQAVYEKLQQLMEQLGNEAPAVMSAFGELHESGVAAGALDTKAKELIALGIAISVRCNGCIAFHVHDALQSGASRAEIVETIGVAVLMGGGPAMVYGCEALEALDEFAASA